MSLMLSSGPLQTKFCGCTPIASDERASSRTLMATTSPLLMMSSHLRTSAKTSGGLNLVTRPRRGTLPSACALKIVDWRAEPRQFARFERNIGIQVAPLRKAYGSRKTLSMMAGGMAGGTQYDDRIPLTDDSGPTTSALVETSSSAAAPFVEESATSISSMEQRIERAIFDFRFLTLFGVVGSLLGAVLCFLKGCMFVAQSYTEYFQSCMIGIHTGRVILYLVEAVDVYLMGTVMLIFGMGLYELFVSSLEVSSGFRAHKGTTKASNFFGLFRLQERPKWLEIRSLDELKTKLGHVIVMILLVGMFEKSKKIIVHTSIDFLCFSASILLSSGSLYLLSMLHSNSSSPNGKHV